MALSYGDLSLRMVEFQAEFRSTKSAGLRQKRVKSQEVYGAQRNTLLKA